MSKAIRLNIGGGITPLKGYLNIDRKLGSEAYPLSYSDGTVDEIRASHILEHFSHLDTTTVLSDWYRALKPGGVLKVAVPDFEALAKAYLDGEPVPIQSLAMGSHSDANDIHGAIFDREALHEALVNVGFTRIARWDSEQKDCASSRFSLNLMGFKPTCDAPRVEGVYAVLPSARFGPAIHHRCCYEAFHKLGINYHVSIGCFLHQVLSEGIEEQIAKPGCRYVLCCDYDSVFSPSDVVELYRLIEAYPDVDAVVPMQQKRGGHDVPLFTLADAKGRIKTGTYKADFDRNLVQLHTGHFGLTLMKADKLRALPRPWMEPKPNSEGRWTGNKVDPDIALWARWRAAGNNLYLAHKVVIGHMEEFILWPNADEMRTLTQPFADYVTNGKPAGVWHGV